MSEFPKPHNGTDPVIKGNSVSFSFLDSFGNIITDTKLIIDSDQVVRRVKARMDRFHKSGPGSRESEESRAERKYLSALPESILRDAWNKLDSHGKMEFEMMFSSHAHFGHSDPDWLKAHSTKRDAIVGDGGEKLMPAKSGKQYRYMQMMAHNPEKSRKMGGPSEAVAKEFIKKTSKKKRSAYSKGY